MTIAYYSRRNREPVAETIAHVRRARGSLSKATKHFSQIVWWLDEVLNTLTHSLVMIETRPRRRSRRRCRP